MIIINLQKYDDLMNGDISHLIIDHRKEDLLKSDIMKEELYDIDGNKLEWNDKYFLYIADYIHCKAFKITILAQDEFHIGSGYNKSYNVITVRDFDNKLPYVETYIININDDMEIRTSNVALMRHIRSRYTIFYGENVINRILSRNKKENFNT